MNYLLELSPENKRPIYVGLSNTLTGGVIVIPLLGGTLVNLFSYEPVFIVTVLCIAPVLALTRKLSEPRKRVAE
jgi:MFS family permease